MNNGWIKIHRSLLNWEWYDDNNTKILFLHLLLKANHKDKKFKGKVIKRGQVMTGYSLLAEQTQLTVKKVRVALKHLKRTNEVAIETSSKGSIIQIVNYDKYQVGANETANKGQTKGKQRATNKNDKKEKNEKNKKVFPSQDYFIRWFNDRKGKHTGVEGKTKLLNKASENNFKKLNESYELQDFETAISNLFKNEWAINNNGLNPAHFLRIDNFTRYLNTEQKKLNIYEQHK